MSTPSFEMLEILSLVAYLAVTLASLVAIWKMLRPSHDARPDAPHPDAPRPDEFRYLESGVPEHCHGFETGWRCFALVYDHNAGKHVRCRCERWVPARISLVTQVLEGKVKPTCLAHRSQFEALGFETVIV